MGGGFGRWVGKGCPSWIRVTCYWETHLWGEPPTGPGVERMVCVPTVVHKEGGRPQGWQSVLPGRCSDLSGSVCATLGMLEARLTPSKATTDSLSLFVPLGVGVHELLRTGHFRNADHSPCSLLPALQGLISGFLMSRARCASSTLVQHFLLFLQAERMRARRLPLGMKAQVSAFES